MEQNNAVPRPVLRSDADKTELDIAREIAGKTLSSPQKFSNVYLFDLRISGTGVSYRKKHNEYVYRSPDVYLNNEFLARCNGLPVIMEHPDKNTLDSVEFNERIIGTILLPYIKGNEVWGIAKIYDDAAARMMSNSQLSTSPAVIFRDPKENETIELEGGSHLLIEGKPSLLDHLAIVEHGVWDKGGTPSGVKSNEISKADSCDEAPIEIEKGATKMADENAVPQDDKLGKILSLLESLDSRMSALELAEEAEAAPAADAMPAEELPVAAAPAVDADNAAPSANIAAMGKRIDGIETQLAAKPSEEEAGKMADAQAKADSVAAAFGDSASRPLQGESLLAYRKRLASKFQAHSKQFKDVKLSSIADASLFDAVEAGIYADALEAAKSPASVPMGMLFERTRSDAAGRKISEFTGHPSAWTNQFKAVKKSLTGINKQFN